MIYYNRRLAMVVPKLTLPIVINECPLIQELHSELCDEEIAPADRWFRWLRERIVDEVHAEIEPQVMKERRERDELKKDRDTLAARVKELEAATAKPAPKPQRTGGQKVFEAYWPDLEWVNHQNQHANWASAAERLGIPDDPEPPSDGELMRKASEASDGSTSAYWAQCAAEFLRLLAERDGGGA